ncbi:MAG: hypothetical protein DWG76_02075 [Chloroflexi bacterium]|nr:hypothetical protein [Chloroflexota bacterium]
MAVAKNKIRAIGNLRLRAWLPQLVLAILALFILMDVSPHRQPNPGTDSGIFLYAGQKINDGATLYNDVWDHKGPMIFYVNALGLALAGGSRWGVWLLEVLAVGAAALIGYQLIAKAFGAWPALFGSVAWLTALPTVLDGGNLTEEYALPMQFGMLALFMAARRAEHRWLEFALGLVAALAFWDRANMIGISMAIGLFLLWEALVTKDRLAWKRIAAILAGFLSLSLLVILAFRAQNALPGLWDASFYYNLIYSDTTAADRHASVIFGLRRLPLLQSIALAGWLLSGLALVGRLEHSDKAQHPALLAVLFIALPLELLLTSLSGRGFPHYFMSWLPVFGLAAAYLLYVILKQGEVARKPGTRGQFAKVLTLSMVMAISLVPLLGILPPAKETISASVAARGLPPVDVTGSRFGPALDYITKHVGPNEDILFWGKLLAINWLSGHDVPSRHIFQDHFFTPGYATPEMIDGYIQDIERSHPVIIDTTIKRVTYPEIGVRNLDKVIEVVRPLYVYIQANYQFVEVLEPYGWHVYRYVGPSLDAEQPNG